MNEEMIELYNKLNTNDKRNEFSSLLIKLDQLVEQLIIQNNINIDDLKTIKNYDSSRELFKSEDEMLLFFYEDVWNIKNKILFLLATKNNK